MRKVLITGVAGFIGYHLAKRLIAENIFVIGASLSEGGDFCHSEKCFMRKKKLC